jgi:hypothetical protein
MFYNLEKYIYHICSISAFLLQSMGPTFGRFIPSMRQFHVIFDPESLYCRGPENDVHKRAARLRLIYSLKILAHF